MNTEQSEALTATEQKLSIAKQKKETGDQAFKQGEERKALASYHEALMYLLGLDKNAMKTMGLSTGTGDGKERTEADEIIEKIYANMSACHIKTGNWKRAVETADKALSKNESNYKAIFRKGKALGEQGFFEKAVKILEDLKVKNPSDTALVDAELARLRHIDNEREKIHKQKLKGFLTRDKGEKKPVVTTSSDSATTAASTATSTADSTTTTTATST